MKLYLSSYRIPDLSRLWELVGKKPSDISVVIIPNAKDYKSAEEYQQKKLEITSYLSDFQMKSDWHDLMKFKNISSLRTTLAKYDLIYVTGGNTFCLRYAMKRSGFDTVLPQLLKQGLTYFGESAGAVVAGSSLRGIELMDHPEYAEKVYFDGLGLVPKMIIPHADSPDFAANVSTLKDMYAPEQSIVLNDNQALVVSDDSYQLVTSSKT